jgi:FkbM family methyltransferase
MKTLIKNTLRPLYRYLKSDNEREFLSILDNYRDRYVEKTVKFLKYNFLLPDVRSFAFQYRDYFVDNNLEFKTDSKIPLIYDCGANVGTTSLYFKILYPDSIVKAFEADPEIFKYLKNNIDQNNLDVVIYNKAVWIDDDGIDFSHDGADAGSIYSNHGSKIKVESIRLRDLLVKEDKIDMLKIDIEGAEVDVISDCEDQLDKVDNMYIEFHSFGNRPQELDVILAILQRNSFRYHFHTFQMRTSPFIDKGETLDIDILMIIFAWKK